MQALSVRCNIKDMKNMAVLGLALFLALPVDASDPFDGKIIALDAGHGSSVSDTGAPNQKYGVIEADVNWDVVAALEVKLKVLGAEVVIADRLPTRKDRVNDAIARCAEFDLNNDGVGDKCDVLVSVHHNGSTELAYDGTLTIYNEKKDKPLAEKMLAALTPLTGNGDGLLHGGYGMTVYGNIISVITEAYYITNDCEAELYLYSKGQLTDTEVSSQCKTGVYTLENRIDREVQLQVNGLSDYFSSPTGGKGRNK